MKKLANFLAYVANLLLASVLAYVALENLYDKDWGAAIMAIIMASVCCEAIYYRAKYTASEVLNGRS